MSALASGWRSVPAGYIFRREKRTGYEGEPLLSVYRDYGVVPKDSRDDNFNKPSEDLSTYQLVEPDDLVINKMKAWQGSLAISTHRGIVSPAYFVARPTQPICARYVHYLIRSEPYLTEYQTRSAGIRVNQWDLDWDDFRRVVLTLPPEVEQERIANFLDEQTARIDALVAEKERLVNVLIEYRSASVTGVLEPDCQASTSHYPKLGYFASIVPGYPFSADDFGDEGIPVVRMSDFNSGVLDLHNARKVPEDKVPQAAYASEGDVLVGLSGSVGEYAVVRSADLPCAVNQRIAIVRPTERVSKRYLACLLSSAFFKDALTMYLPSTTIQNVSAGQLCGCRLPLPDLKTQEARSAHIEALTFNINKLVAHTVVHMDRLREYRSSLISAAVTGQLDISTYKSKELEAA